MVLTCYGSFPGPPANSYGYGGRSPIQGTPFTFVEHQLIENEVLRSGTEHVFSDTHCP